MAQEGVNEREIILDILLECERGEFLSLILRNVLDKYGYLPDFTRAFIKHVCEGTIERRITLDLIIDAASSVKTSKMKPLIRNLVRMSVYQIRFMDQVPSSAAINEAVKLFKERHCGTLSGFVNGVLRSIDRMSGDDVGKLLGENLCAIYSCPEWIVKLAESNYGKNNTEKILARSLTAAPLCVRANRRKNTREELMALLSREGITSYHHSFAPDCLVLEGCAGVGGLDAFRQGRFTVQDAASQLVGMLSGASGNMKVLDLCAAPGGKATHMAELVCDAGCVIANDVSEYKLSLIEENAERLGDKNIQLSLFDATVFNAEFEEGFDVVIADLPCSGLGVMGRKSDLKYRVKPEDLGALKSLQKQILKNAAGYVKKGGTLLYSTCTINPGENIRQIPFITGELGLEAVSIEEMLPPSLKGRGGENGYIQLLQGVDDCDGFFISKFIKKDA